LASSRTLTRFLKGNCKSASKPALLTVDDDQVLRAERDLRREYGDRFRVLQADSGTTALEALKQLKLRNDPVALFLVDQRMPQMSGVEFLEEAMKLFPEAKRVLLTAYADTDAAIHAINSVKTDYPPEAMGSEERLYPVVNDCSMTGSRRSAHHGDSCGWFPLVATIASNQRLLGPKSGALVDGHGADEARAWSSMLNLMPHSYR